MDVPDLRNKAEIAAYVRARRKARGWSQRELERRAGTGTHVVNKIEVTDRVPNFLTMMKILRALDG